MNKKIPMEVSARHIHLSQKHLEILFGKDFELNNLNDLSQTGEFAAQEQLDVVGPKGKLEGVRIIGPTREKTQVEISKTDGFKIGQAPELRVSGDTENTPGVKLVGPEGEVDLPEGLIMAKRHIHMSPQDAEELGVKNKQSVSVQTSGSRAVTFHNVVVRVKNTFKLSCQIDTDEGNAGDIKSGDLGEIVKE